MNEISLNSKAETLVVLGGPGSGKDTQVAFLVEALGYQEISSGQLIRLRAEHDDEVRKILESGRLAPDGIVDDEIISAFALLPDDQPVIINGYPRTQDQAKKLEVILAENNRRVDKALYIKVKEKALAERIGKRRACTVCGHFTDDSQKKCPECDGALTTRKDDTPRAVKRRLEIFKKETEPVFDFYRKKKVLIEVDGNPPVEKVKENVRKAI